MGKKGKRKIITDEELGPIYEKFKKLGLTPTESYDATVRVDNYRNKYHIQSFSDMELVQELVFREVIQERYKNEILTKNKKTEDPEEKAKLASHNRRAMDDNFDRMLIIREKLGLFQKDNKKDPYEYLRLLEKKFAKHREENAGDYSLPCPLCQKMIFLMFKVKDYEAKQHPFFPKGKFLTNDYLWKLYKEGKLSKEDLAKVFQASLDYIDWLEKHIYKNPSQ